MTLNSTIKIGMLLTIFALTKTSFSKFASAQIIDFETLPNDSIPTDNQELLDSYNINGTNLIFGFDINRDLVIDFNARIESRTDSPNTRFAYTHNIPGGFLSDVDLTETGEGGNFLLRTPQSTTTEGAYLSLFDDIPGATSADFIVQYTGTPTNSTSGQLWDIDGGENYLIEALQTDGTLIDSLITPTVPIGEGEGTLNSLPFDFSFSNLAEDIGFLRISGSNQIAGGGFAFDNFVIGETFETVPEPSSTIALLSIVSGLAVMKLKKGSLM